MKIDKSLAEVWEWKDKVYEDIKTLSGKELKEHFEKITKDVEKKYKIKIKAYKSETITT